MNNAERRLYKEIYGPLMSKMVAQKQLEKAQQGLPSANPPLGYKWVQIGSRRKGHKEIVIDEEKSKIVIQIFNLYSSGMFSLKTLSTYIKEHFSYSITSSGIQVLLKNKFYIGLLEFKDKEYTHHWPLFIDKEIWNKTNIIRDSSVKRRAQIKSVKPYVWRGFLKCAECECLLTPEGKKNRFGSYYVYYHCTQSKFRHKALYITEEYLTEKIEKIISEIYSNNPELQSLVPLPEINWKKPEFESTRIFMGKIIKCMYFAQDRKISYETWPIKTIELRLKPEQKLESFVESNTLSENIHIICRMPHDIDKLAQLLKKDIHEIQMTLIDMQLNGLIDQTLDGAWLSL